MMSPICSRRRLLAVGSAAFIARTLPSARGAEPEIEKFRIGLGFSLYGMKSLEIGEALFACGKQGYDCVEFALMPGYHADPLKLSPEDRKRLRDLLIENKLRVAAYMENLLLLAEERQHQLNLDRLKLAGELCHALGPDKPPIETVLGGKPAQWEENRGRMVERLAAWAKVAEEAQTVIAIKGHVGNAAHLPEHVSWLVTQVDSPWLKATYDHSHFELRGIDVTTSLKMLLPHTAFIHVKDARGDAAKFQFLLPGQGKTDYLAYAKLLGELGYRGDIVVEVSGQISSRADYDPLEATRRCYDHLAPALARAGVRKA